MTFGNSERREYYYDIETTRLLDDLRDLRGLEERDDYSEMCEDALKLFGLHLEPIVDIYFQKDLGDDREFVVKAKPWTKADVALLLAKHVRSFTEFGLPGVFERHARQLEIFASRPDGYSTTLAEALQYIAVMRSLVKLFPERIDVNAKDGISKEKAEEAEMKLREGKEKIQDAYRKIKDEVLDKLAADRRGNRRSSFRDEDSREGIRFQEPMQNAPTWLRSSDRSDLRNDGYSRQSSDRYRDGGYNGEEFGERRRYRYADHGESMARAFERPQRNGRDQPLYRTRTDSPEYGDRRDGYGHGWDAQSPPERDRGPFYRTHYGDRQRNHSGYGGEAYDGNRGWGSATKGSERFNDFGPTDRHSPRYDAFHSRGIESGMQLPKRPPRRGAPQGPSRSASGGVPRDNMTGLSISNRGELGRSLSDADRARYERAPSWESRGNDRYGERGSSSGRKFSERQGFGRLFGSRQDFDRSTSSENRGASEEASRGSGWDTAAVSTQDRSRSSRYDSSREYDRNGRDERRIKEKSKSCRDDFKNSEKVATGWGAASTNAGSRGWGDTTSRSKSVPNVDSSVRSNVITSENPWGGSAQQKPPGENHSGSSAQQEAPGKNPWGSSAQQKAPRENHWGSSAQQEAPGKNPWGSSAQQKAPRENQWGSSAQQKAPEQSQWGSSVQQKPPGENHRESSTQQKAPEKNPWGSSAQQESPGKSPRGSSAQQKAPDENPWGSSTQQKAPGENPWGSSTQQKAPGENPWGSSAQQKAPEKNPWGSSAQQEAPGKSPRGSSAQQKAPGENPWGSSTQQKAPGENPWGSSTQQKAPEQTHWESSTQQKAPGENQWGRSVQQKAPGENQWGRSVQQKAPGENPWGSSAQQKAPKEDLLGSSTQQKASAENPWGSSAQQKTPEDNPWGSSTQQKDPGENPWGVTNECARGNVWGPLKSETTDDDQKTEKEQQPTTTLPAVQEIDPNARLETSKGSLQDNVQRTGNPDVCVTPEQSSWNQSLEKTEEITVAQDNPWGKTTNGSSENRDNPWAQTVSPQTVPVNPWSSNVELPVVSAPVMPIDPSMQEKVEEIQKDSQSPVNDQQSWESSKSSVLLAGSMPGASSPSDRQQNNLWHPLTSTARSSTFGSEFVRVSSAPNSLNDANAWNSQAQQDMVMWNTGDAMWRSDPPTEISNYNPRLPIHRTEEEKHISASSEMHPKDSTRAAMSQRRLKPPPGFEGIARTASMPHSSLSRSAVEEKQNVQQSMEIMEEDNDSRPPGI